MSTNYTGSMPTNSTMNAPAKHQGQIDGALSSLSQELTLLEKYVAELLEGDIPKLEGRISRVGYFPPMGEEAAAESSDPKTQDAVKRLVPLAEEIGDYRARVATITRLVAQAKERIGYVTNRVEL